MSGSSAWDATEGEETTLVAAIAAGDRESESIFAARYMPKVRTLLIVRSRNPELAWDLQQEVMIEALCALRKGQLRQADRLPAFVAGITRHVLNNYFRGQKGLPLHEELPIDIPDFAAENSPDIQHEEEKRQTAH